MNPSRKDRALSQDPTFIEHAQYHAKLAATGNRLAAQYLMLVGALTIVLVLLLLGGDRFWIQLLFAGLVFLLPWHHSAAILFFLVQASLFIHEGRVGLAKLDYNPFIVSVLTLLFVAFADRFRTSWRTLGDGTLRGLRNSMLSLGESPRRDAQLLPSSETPPSNEASSTAMLGRVLRTIGVALLAVFIAASVMVMFPQRPQAESEIKLAPQELRAISLAVFVLLVGIIASHLVSAVFWRWLSPLQARVYLRSLANQWLRPEGRAIAVREIKRQKRINKSSKRS